MSLKKSFFQWLKGCSSERGWSYLTDFGGASFAVPSCLHAIVLMPDGRKLLASCSKLTDDERVQLEELSKDSFCGNYEVVEFESCGEWNGLKDRMFREVKPCQNNSA